MVPRLLLLPLVALCALGGCLTPDYHCRILCEPGTRACPTGFHCENAGALQLCARDDIPRTCEGAPPDAGGDAAVDASPPDAPAPPAPPSELCLGGSCLTLGPQMQQALVLWLDPSNLPPAGTAVGRWPDRSGRRNDALALSPESLPMSSGKGLQLHAGPAGSLRILQDASLDFGAGDFTVLLVATVATTSISCLYANLDGNRADPRGVELRWGFSPRLMSATFMASINRTELDSNRAGLGDQRPHLFVLRRAGGLAELRLDAMAIGVTPLEAPDVSTTTSRPIYLGGCSDSGWPIVALHAVTAFKGEVSLLDLMKLESFLVQSFTAAP